MREGRTIAASICPICKQQTCNCLLDNRQFLAREVGKLMKGGDGSLAIAKLMRGKAGSPATQKKNNRQKLRDQYGGNYYCFATPVWLRGALTLEYGYPEMDVASSHGMEFGNRYYTPDVDGLKQDWVNDSEGGLVFGNPPYNWKELGRWVEKAFQTSQAGCTVIFILPLWRKYDWFGKFIVPYAEVRLPAVPVVSGGIWSDGWQTMRKYKLVQRI